ncbi:MAG TPA: M23 family metallopeptidase [Thermodesulfobacteriota bacterium]|nr:M23 family metallopeptidase [Thermodesulfobacteriota bacterium]
MNRIRRLLKKGLTTVSIMVVPHESVKAINVRMPLLVIFAFFLSSGVGIFYLVSLAANGLEYPSMVKKVDYYAQQFSRWESTISSLKKAEEDFTRIFSLTSREKILESIDTNHSGSIDLSNLVDEIQKSREAVDEIKDYLRTKKDIYVATPKGLPVEGRVSSPYGMRENPFTGEDSFHSGVDISASPGSTVRATADGVVSFSGWTSKSGYVVALEHGAGISTFYAHNQKNAVKIGDRVRRGETIAFVGSTGKSTGPHVHYEVWEKGRIVNPRKFQNGRS